MQQDDPHLVFWAVPLVHVFCKFNNKNNGPHRGQASKHSLLPSNSRIDGFTSPRLATMSRELDRPLVLPNTLPAALSFLWCPFLEEEEADDVLGSSTSGTSMQSYCFANLYAADLWGDKRNVRYEAPGGHGRVVVVHGGEGGWDVSEKESEILPGTGRLCASCSHM